jgi:hypothetical protein
MPLARIHLQRHTTIVSKLLLFFQTVSHYIFTIIVPYFHSYYLALTFNNDTSHMSPFYNLNNKSLPNIFMHQLFDVHLQFSTHLLISSP